MAGLEVIKEMGLDGIEVQFTRGVKMTSELALKVRQKAKDLNLTITAHGPYWINLNSQEKRKKYASINYILQTATKGHQLGAKSLTFHPAYMHGKPDEEVLKDSAKVLKIALQKIAEAKATDVKIAPELTGKPSQFGSIDHLINLAKALNKKITLCLDFSHNYARSIGKANGREAFQDILDKIKKELGASYLKNFHMHMGGMIFGPKGELRHRPLTQENEFKWQELLEVLKENRVEGWITIETPDIETSTKLAKDYYLSL